MSEKEKKVYEDIRELGYFFNPKITYKEVINLCDRPFDTQTLDASVYDINTDVLAINSLYKNGENAYVRYLQDHLYKTLDLDEDNYRDMQIKDRILPLLSIRYDNKTKSRKLTYNYEYLFLKITNILQINCEDHMNSVNYKPFYNHIKKTLDKYIDVIDKAISGKNISNDEIEYLKKVFSADIKKKAPENYLIKQINGINNISKPVNAKEKDKKKKPNCYIEPKEYKKLKGLYDLSRRLKRALNNFNSAKLDVNLDDFFELFDAPTLYLIMAKLSLDYAFYAHNNFNIGPLYCVSEVRDYVFYILDKLGKDHNPSIRMYNSDTKEIVAYDFNSLKNELNEYLSLYPKSFDTLSMEEIEKNNIKTVEDLEAYYEKKKNDDIDTLFASWEFIKKSEKASNDNVKKSKQINRNTIDNENKAREKYNKALSDAKERREFLDNTNYLYNIIGLNNFDGYEGYIYSDGTVLLEHIYSDSTTKTPCLDAGATYIMNIYNFIEFSKKTKTEIIDYISNTENPDVIRKYHSKNWKANIFKYVNGKKMNIDVLLIINKLINDGTLLKVTK